MEEQFENPICSGTRKSLYENINYVRVETNSYIGLNLKEKFLPNESSGAAQWDLKRTKINEEYNCKAFVESLPCDITIEHEWVTIKKIPRGSYYKSEIYVQCNWTVVIIEKINKQWLYYLLLNDYDELSFRRRYERS